MRTIHPSSSLLAVRSSGEQLAQRFVKLIFPATAADIDSVLLARVGPDYNLVAKMTSRWMMVGYLLTSSMAVGEPAITPRRARRCTLQRVDILQVNAWDYGMNELLNLSVASYRLNQPMNLQSTTRIVEKQTRRWNLRIPLHPFLLTTMNHHQSLAMAMSRSGSSFTILSSGHPPERSMTTTVVVRSWEKERRRMLRSSLRPHLRKHSNIRVLSNRSTHTTSCSFHKLDCRRLELKPVPRLTLGH